MGALGDRLSQPRDAASSAAFRVLFGLIVAGSVVRYFASGWIERFYVRPRFHFHYYGFEWVQAPPEPWLSALFVLLGLAGLGVALGLFHRLSAALVLGIFTYLHLLDVTNYLNHYWLVTLLAALFCVLPLNRTWSLDARRDPSIRSETVPAWVLYLLRFQIGLVYVFAALAKVGPDWLLHGQPLGIWLHARTETPVIGPLLGQPWVAIAMSWAGFLYDLTIVFWLSWRRSRPYAFAAVCVFHALTGYLFFIGIFPVIMTAGATLFFSPEWPRALHARLRRVTEGAPAPRRIGRLGVALLALWALVMVAIPLRAHLYGGDVLWHEQGMRWSWRVKVREKNGDVRYRVRMDGERRERVVRPSRYLEPRQEVELAGQPDLILQLAHHIADELRAQGHTGVEVRADAWASLNGRPSARLIDPSVDLTTVEDGFARADWILPRPDTAPLSMRPATIARVGVR